jgi:hypothetical protein
MLAMTEHIRLFIRQCKCVQSCFRPFSDDFSDNSTLFNVTSRFACMDDLRAHKTVQSTCNKKREKDLCEGEKLAPLASFSVLFSDLLHVHCFGACSVPETFFSPLRVSCLRTIVGALMVLCPQSFLLLRLKHRTIALVLQRSLLFSLLCLKRVTTGGSVEVGKGGGSEEEDACYDTYKKESNNHFGVHSFSPPFFFARNTWLWRGLDVGCNEVFQILKRLIRSGLS